MIFYGLKTCDTCRKALAALRKAGFAPEVVDVRADGIAQETLAGWMGEIGADTLINRRSTTWRELSDEARKEAGNPAGAAALLRAHPTLMKRPVIIADGRTYVGWGPETQAAFM